MKLIKNKRQFGITLEWVGIIGMMFFLGLLILQMLQ